MTDPSVHIQVDPIPELSIPSWFGEVAIVAHAFQRFGLFKAINARPPTAPSLEITLHGLPAPFVESFSLPVRRAA